MATRALITGIRGFTGQYMAAELVQAGYEVFGLAHGDHGTTLPGVKKIGVCDLDDQQSLHAAIAAIQPDIVIHLAAIAFVAHGDANAIYRTNVIGTRNLLEALSTTLKTPSAVLVASSANVYGNSTEGTLDECIPAAPANDYAVSKLAMEYLAKTYMNKLPIIIARPFNYTGVHQSDSFLLPKIVRHVRRLAPVIELGNINVSRDFSDVRTVVQYYRKLVEHPAAIGEIFNVCSEEAHSLNDVLKLALSIADHKMEIQINPLFVRQNEIPVLIGSKSKLVSLVGDVKKIELADTLRWMIE